MNEVRLSDVIVLELGGYLAAPFAGEMLVRLGATVIKVESLRGDPTRQLSSAGTFITQNLGKKSLAIDLDSQAGYSIFGQLLRRAHVVVHNLSADSVRKLQVGWNECQEINAELVYCQIAAYGPGPLHDAKASNPIVEAAMGTMYYHRVNGRPTRHDVAYYDMTAGSMAVMAILAALVERDSERRPRRLEVPLYETALYLSAPRLVSDQLNPSFGRVSEAGRSDFATPGYGAYETADGRWVYVVMLTDGNWRQFCRAMDLGSDVGPELGTATQRRQHAALVEQLVSSAIGALPYEEVAGRLRAAGVGFEEVRNSGSVVDHEQARAPGKFQAIDFRGTMARSPSSPILGIGRQDQAVAPPELGQDTVPILRTLGYDEPEISAFLENGIVAGLLTPPQNVEPGSHQSHCSPSGTGRVEAANDAENTGS